MSKEFAKRKLKECLLRGLFIYFFAKFSHDQTFVIKNSYYERFKHISEKNDLGLLIVHKSLWLLFSGRNLYAQRYWLSQALTKFQLLFEFSLIFLKIFLSLTKRSLVNYDYWYFFLIFLKEAKFQISSSLSIFTPKVPKRCWDQSCETH